MCCFLCCLYEYFQKILILYLKVIVIIAETIILSVRVWFNEIEPSWVFEAWHCKFFCNFNPLNHLIVIFCVVFLYLMCGDVDLLIWTYSFQDLELLWLRANLTVFGFLNNYELGCHVSLKAIDYIFTLQQSTPYLREVSFCSPYRITIWGILCHKHFCYFSQSWWDPIFVS